MQKSILSPSFFIGKKRGSLISFGAGQPDLPPPKEIYQDLLSNLEGKFQYGLIQGDSILREALVKYHHSAYPTAHKDHFVITNGGSEALDLIIRCLKRRGAKTILIPRPYYYSYPHLIEFSKLQPVYYELVNGHIDLKTFKPQLQQADIALINSPSNPAGSVEDPNVLQEIESIIHKQNTFLICDDVYKDLIYEKKHYPIQGQQVITVNSFSKTFGMCGFRVGYMYTQHMEIIEKIVEMKNHTSMNTGLLSQKMALKALSLSNEYINNNRNIWRKRRDVVYQEMLSMGLDLWKPEGGFYVFPRFENPQKIITDLYYKHNVVAYDGAWFGCKDRVRFSYALDIDKIKEGLARVKTYLQQEKLL